MVSAKIVDYLPLYSRMLDEYGILEHFADALQPQFDEILQVLDLREPYFDIDVCPSDWIHWVAQFAGLANVKGDWIGIGLNPAWEDSHKRDVTNQAVRYYSRKGTEQGIREACALWLQLKAARTERLKIHLPFGKRSTAYPPNWWDYATPYDFNLNEVWGDKKFFGAGDYVHSYHPGWKFLNGWSIQEYNHTLWSDRVLEAETASEVIGLGSGLGVQRPWMEFSLQENEWNQVFPNILKLNYEAWSTFAEPEVFGWLTYKTRPYSLVPTEQQRFQEFEILNYDGFKYYDLWHYNAGQLIEEIEIVETQEYFGVSPGQSFEDVWASDDFPVPFERLYYHQDVLLTIREEVVVPTFTPCSPGFLGEVSAGTEQRQVGGFDSIPPNATLRRTEAFDISLNLATVSKINLSTFARMPSRLAPNVRALPPIESPVAMLIDVGFNYGEVKGGTIAAIELEEVPVFSLNNEKVITNLSREAGYAWVEPVDLFTFGSIWNEGSLYYSGFPAIPPTLETVQALQTKKLCNLVDRYSIRIIERETRFIEVDNTTGNLDLFETYPALEVASVGDNWTLLLETDKQIYLLKPSTFFFSDLIGSGKYSDRNQSINLDSKPQSLYLEFLVQPEENCQILRFTVLLGDRAIDWHEMSQPLYASEDCVSGIRLAVPLVFGSGANSFVEDLQVSAYLPVFARQLQRIRTAAKLPKVSKLAVVRLATARIDTVLTELIKEFSMPDQNLFELLERTRLALDEAIAQIESINQPRAIVFTVPLTDGSFTRVSDTLYETSFVVNTGLDTNDFGIGELRRISTQERLGKPKYLPINPATPGIVEVIVSGAAPILDNTLEVVIYAQKEY